MIDMLTADGQIPLIIGDEESMRTMIGLKWPIGDDSAALLFEEDGSRLEWPMIHGGASRLKTANLVVIVSLSAEDEVVSAHIHSRDGSEPQEVSFDQVSRLSKLVTAQGVEYTCLL